MDEKQPFLRPSEASGPPAQPGHHELRRTRRRRLILVTCFLGLLALIHMPWRTPRTGHHCSHHHRGPRHYEGEHITWEPCGDIKDRPLECSTITVPMDQFDATNTEDKVFTIPLIRMRGKNATQNLLLNPGGPGGSGFEFLHRRGEQLSTIVGEGFHLLSFDPRGINGSTPKAACYPDKKTREALSYVRDTKVIEDSPEAYAFAKNFVRACSDTLGEHGLYINTPQTAADMNSILDAVGQKEMIYWGFSYVSEILGLSPVDPRNLWPPFAENLLFGS